MLMVLPFWCFKNQLLKLYCPSEPAVNEPKAEDRGDPPPEAWDEKLPRDELLGWKSCRLTAKVPS